MAEERYKVSIKKIAHYVHFSLLVAVIVSFYAVLIFLYNSVYMVIDQSDVLIILKKDVATDSVDVGKFNGIIGKLQQKSVVHDVGQISSPF